MKQGLTTIISARFAAGWAERIVLLVSLCCLVAVTFCISSNEWLAPEAPVERPGAATLGEFIFFDTTLSSPPGTGCVSCHQPNHGFADPRRVSPGALPGTSGTRNAPTLMYAALIPPMAYEDQLINGEEIYVWEGGMFHDGRARDLFEQVSQPFFSKQEMNLSDASELATRVRSAPYAARFKAWVGSSIWQEDKQLTYHAYRATVEFLKEPEFRPFDARIDDYLAGDETALSPLEQRGLDVFRNAGRCADCHLLEPHSWEQPLLSDYGYDNLGVPSRDSKDPGLGEYTGEPAEVGQFKSPTLRNIALTAPYMHNGSIRTLREVMEFYNKRDVEPKRWGRTDYPSSVNHDDMGNLGLTDADIDALVALMHAFTDRTLLTKPRATRLPQPKAGTPTTAQRRLFFPDWTHRLSDSFPGKPDMPR